MTSWVAIRRFEWREDAGRAKSVLDAEEISSVLMHDDAGGWDAAWPMPTWSQARLLVRTEDVDRAGEALSPIERSNLG